MLVLGKKKAEAVHVVEEEEEEKGDSEEFACRGSCTWKVKWEMYI